MFHVSVKALGWIVGGPDTVIQALQDATGTGGTLMMYTGWEDSPYRLDQWAQEKRDAYLAECPPYDPQHSRAYRKWSILTEYLRTTPGSLRSQHPDGSFTALGRLAGHLTQDHALQYGYGEHSPLHRLVECQGKVALLGSPLTDITLLHYAEHRANLEGKRIVRYTMPVLQDGKRVWVDVEEFDTSNSIVPAADDLEYFVMIAEEFIAKYSSAGLVQKGVVGNAQSYLFHARELALFAQEWLENRFSTQ